MKTENLVLVKYMEAIKKKEQIIETDSLSEIRECIV